MVISRPLFHITGIHFPTWNILIAFYNRGFISDDADAVMHTKLTLILIIETYNIKHHSLAHCSMFYPSRVNSKPPTAQSHSISALHTSFHYHTHSQQMQGRHPHAHTCICIRTNSITWWSSYHIHIPSRCMTHTPYTTVFIPALCAIPSPYSCLFRRHDGWSLSSSAYVFGHLFVSFPRFLSKGASGP